MAVLGEDHDCAWKVHAERLDGELTSVKDQLAQLQRHIFGKRSEKMPPVASELKKTGTPADAEKAKQKREDRAKQKRELPARQILHAVPPEKRHCPSCGSHDLRPLGKGKVTAIYERIRECFERQEHVQEVLTCRCGEGVVTAEAPVKPFEKTQYGPELIAHLVVSKCADSIPLYRLEKMYARGGVPLARSTMVDLFHRIAEEVVPLTTRLLAIIASRELVLADETPVKVMAPKKCRRGFMWTFLTPGDKPLIGYRFSPSRSGKTPSEVLGASKGTLLVDGYTGYNEVTTPERRERAGCWAHARRKFFDALPTAPAAQRALDLILDLYRVEHDARAEGVSRSEKHLAMRQARSKLVLEQIKSCLAEQLPLHPPKSPMGMAIRYSRNQWTALCRFINDPQIPLDNNASEGALRVVALGRKNFLFVGHDQAGENLAGLYSLVATCEANGINPQEYLADVIMRVSAHPQAKIDELLPHHWARLRDVATS